MSEKEMANITAEANEGRLSTLAAEINTIKRQTQRIMLGASVEIGRRLVEAKGAVGHGNWGAWLEANVDYSERTAQNLIRIFQEYGEGQQSLFGPENPQSLADLDLTYTQAVALLGIKNPDERMEFIETHDVTNMTSRELADAIKERDEARAALEAEKEARERAETESQDLQRNIDALEKSMKEAQETAGGEPDAETKARIEAMEGEKAALKAKLSAVKKEFKDTLAAKVRAIEILQQERDHAATQRAKIAKEKIEQERELTKEMDALRAQVARMAKEMAKEQNADPGKAAFSAYFNLAKNAFNGMLEAVTQLEDGQEKYRAAMVKMLEAMIETVKESTDE